MPERRPALKSLVDEIVASGVTPHTAAFIPRKSAEKALKLFLEADAYHNAQGALSEQLMRKEGPHYFHLEGVIAHHSENYADADIKKVQSRVLPAMQEYQSAVSAEFKRRGWTAPNQLTPFAEVLDLPEIKKPQKPRRKTKIRFLIPLHDVREAIALLKELS